MDSSMFKLAFYVAVFTAVVGLISRLFWQRDDDDRRRTPHKNAANKQAKSAA
jgi:hypothetical protein